MGPIVELPNGDLLYQSGGTLEHITWDDSGQPTKSWFLQGLKGEYMCGT